MLSISSQTNYIVAHYNKTDFLFENMDGMSLGHYNCTMQIFSYSLVSANK